MDSSNGPCLPYLKALSDETRWQMVEALISSENALTLGQLATRLDISTYNASRHVSVLEEVGIVSTEKRGRNKYLAVAAELRDQISSGTVSREVLNLGCCSFEFPGSPSARKK